MSKTHSKMHARDTSLARSTFSLAGMDYLCGRLVTYDEIPGDFASESNDRIEYYKSISVSHTL